jgi:anti-sigma regulatory factor (Ser/Thr protein kinase)
LQQAEPIAPPTTHPKNAPDALRPAQFVLDGRCSDAELAHWMGDVEAFIVLAASSGGLDEDAAFFLGVATWEALTNAVRHGSPPDGPPWVHVSVRMSGRGVLCVTIRDRGPGFDPAQVADPLCPENLPRNCGRGLLFMRGFTDRLAFACTVQGVVVRLEKRLPLEPTYQ